MPLRQWSKLLVRSALPARVKLILDVFSAFRTRPHCYYLGAVQHKVEPSSVGGSRWCHAFELAPVGTMRTAPTPGWGAQQFSPIAARITSFKIDNAWLESSLRRVARRCRCNAGSPAPQQRDPSPSQHPRPIHKTPPARPIPFIPRKLMDSTTTSISRGGQPPLTLELTLT